MYRNLLPIGSIVLLKEVQKRIMIVGRVVTRTGEDRINDYVGCLYPEGIIDPNNMFFFNHEMIEKVYFIGFQDAEELEFRENVFGRLDDGKVVVENGQIMLIE